MGVEFEKSFYFFAVKKDKDFSNDLEIQWHAKGHQQFHYGNVGLKEFSNQYSDEGWLGRRITAIPFALWSGVVKVVYHIAQAIFINNPQPFANGNLYKKAQFFSAIRDLQESFGYFATFVNDKFGSFHVQEARFHKSYYECFYNDDVPVEDFFTNSDSHSSVPSSSSGLSTSSSYSSSKRKKATSENPHLKQATIYLDGGNLKQAFDEIQEMYSSDHEIKESFFAKLAQIHFDNGNEDNVREIVITVVKSSLGDQFKKCCSEIVSKTGQIKTTGNSPEQLQALLLFYDQLSKVCYVNAKEHFEAKKPQDALSAIKQTACEQENVQKFLNFMGLT